MKPVGELVPCPGGGAAWEGRKSLRTNHVDLVPTLLLIGRVCTGTSLNYGFFSSL